jgi:AraC-like DNA-binding protein
MPVSSPVHLIFQMADRPGMILPDKTFRHDQVYFAGILTEPEKNGVRFLGTTIVCGLTLTPLGIWLLFRLKLADFMNGVVEYEAATKVPYPAIFTEPWDKFSFDDRYKASLNWLKLLISKKEIPLNYTEQNLQLLYAAKGNGHIKDLSLRLSERHVERVIKEIIGVSPKYYSRMLRFNRSIGMIGVNSNMPFHEVAHYCGYTDVQHLYKEFNLLGHMRPSDLSQIEVTTALDSNLLTEE